MAGTVPMNHPTPETDGPVELRDEDLQFMGAAPVDVKLPSTVFDECIGRHSHAEHMAAMDGPAFDPIHLLIRSQVRAVSRDEDIQTLAAVCKARHDLAFWAPMVELGLRGGFTGHVDDLYRAADLLDRFVPRTAALQVMWEDARSALLGALPNPKRIAA